MIKKGDRVKFISDTTTGIVSSINGAVANVTIEDGFEVPVLITDLVAVNEEEEKKAINKMGVGDGTPIVKGKPQKNTQPKEKTASRHSEQRFGKIALTDDYEDDDPIDLSYIKSNYIRKTAETNDAAIVREEEIIKAALSPLELTDYDIKLCFVPDNDDKPEESGNYGLWLVNDSSYEVYYSISKWGAGNFVTNLSSGKIEDDSKEELSVIAKGQLSTQLRLQINLIMFKRGNFVPQPAEDFTLEIPPLKFLRRGNYEENDFFDEKVLMFTLATSKAEKKVQIPSSEMIKKSLREKDDIKPAAKNIDRRLREPEIIDLHAEEVLDSTEGMSPGEILKAQMSRFEIAVDLAVRNDRGGKIVFIHGVGSGKLKYEMQKLLKSKYPKIRFQDASFKEYGYGAIMVYL